MRELEVLDNGHLKLDFAECKEFFEQELAERVRAQLKRLTSRFCSPSRTAIWNSAITNTPRSPA